MLLLSDRVDEWLTSHFTEFEGKPLQSVAKGDLNLAGLEDEEEKRQLDEAAGEMEGLTAQMKEALGDESRPCASAIA